jgi:hypothetical protein
MPSPEQDLAEIKTRNARVEADKAWETSWVRRLIIAAFTYIVAAIWLMLIRDTLPALKALVPTIGYILSTLSLGAIKRQWLRGKLNG